MDGLSGTCSPIKLLEYYSLPVPGQLKFVLVAYACTSYLPMHIAGCQGHERYECWEGLISRLEYYIPLIKSGVKVRTFKNLLPRFVWHNMASLLPVRLAICWGNIQEKLKRSDAKRAFAALDPRVCKSEAIKVMLLRVRRRKNPPVCREKVWYLLTGFVTQGFLYANSELADR